jgi:hypothetical protein
VSFRNEGHVYSAFDVYDGESENAVHERGVLISFPEERKGSIKLVCEGATVSHLGKLESILSCDEKLSFGGCKRD